MSEEARRRLVACLEAPKSSDSECQQLYWKFQKQNDDEKIQEHSEICETLQRKLRDVLDSKTTVRSAIASQTKKRKDYLAWCKQQTSKFSGLYFTGTSLAAALSVISNTGGFVVPRASLVELGFHMPTGEYAGNNDVDGSLSSVRNFVWGVQPQLDLLYYPLSMAVQNAHYFRRMSWGNSGYVERSLDDRLGLYVEDLSKMLAKIKTPGTTSTDFIPAIIGMSGANAVDANWRETVMSRGRAKFVFVPQRFVAYAEELAGSTNIIFGAIGKFLVRFNFVDAILKHLKVPSIPIFVLKKCVLRDPLSWTSAQESTLNEWEEHLDVVLSQCGKLDTYEFDHERDDPDKFLKKHLQKLFSAPEKAISFLSAEQAAYFAGYIFRAYCEFIERNVYGAMLPDKNEFDKYIAGLIETRGHEHTRGRRADASTRAGDTRGRHART